MNLLLLSDHPSSDHLSSLHRIHSTCLPPGWSAAEFARLLADPVNTALAAETEGKLAGFILYRAVADEAEILTFAVLREYRRKGIGRKLLEAAMEKLKHAGIRKLFLEVAEGNEAAIVLYKGLGAEAVGNRKSYYADGDLALVLSIAL